MPVNLIFSPIYAAKLKPKFGSKTLNTPGLLKLFSVEHPSGFPTFLNFCRSPTQQMLTGLQLNYPYFLAPFSSPTQTNGLYVL